MIEQDFFRLSEEILTNLADEIEKKDKNAVFDVEYSDGILNIVFDETGQTYVINKHSASQKIWYSSPMTGANYFSFDKNSSDWIDAKGDNLTSKLFSELSEYDGF